MEEKIIKEIERKLLKDKNFQKELSLTLLTDYLENPRAISFENVKKKTQDFLRHIAELELQSSIEEEETPADSEDFLEN